MSTTAADVDSKPRGMCLGSKYAVTEFVCLFIYLFDKKSNNSEKNKKIKILSVSGGVAETRCWGWS